MSHIAYMNQASHGHAWRRILKRFVPRWCPLRLVCMKCRRKGMYVLYINTCTRMHIRTRANSHARTHAYTCTHTHTHIQSKRSVCCSCLSRLRSVCCECCSVCSHKKLVATYRVLIQSNTRSAHTEQHTERFARVYRGSST